MSKIKKPRTSIQRITVLALLLATEIVFARFLSISMPIVRIGFAFLPLALAAYLYGPVGGMIVGGLGDFIGATLFPTSGSAYFPGFTATAILTGFCFGLFLHKQLNLKRIIFAVLTTQIICGLLLNSLWLSIITGTPYIKVFLFRIIQVSILIAVEIIILPITFKYLQNLEKSGIYFKIVH